MQKSLFGFYLNDGTLSKNVFEQSKSHKAITNCWLKIRELGC